MGTNVYFYRKLDQEILDTIREDFAKLDNLPDMKQYLNNLYYPEYEEIHVGKRSLGWEFIFSEDIYELCGEEQIMRILLFPFSLLEYL